MSINKLNILINDTTGVIGTDVLKRTQRANPHLVYNGGDTEFQPIVASKLSFNMLVENAVDAKFLHLFTGDETRYEVQLEDAETGTIYWQGFLLPDLYQEPYENGSFFVDFTATDGLGRLKNKYLSNSFYKDVKDIPEILGACLQLTGLNFNTIIAPAITNAAATITVKDVEIDTSNFIKDNKKQDAYTILEGLLTTMGCRLFQWQEKWYVVGINRFNSEEVYCEFYTPQGYGYVADNIESFNRTIKSVKFESTPQITAIPPIKTVSIDWSKNTTSSVLPTDVVYQIPLNEGYTDAVPRYWQQIGSGWDMLLTGKSYFGYSVTLFSFTSQSPYLINDPFYLSLTDSVASASIESNYATLQSGVYIKGDIGLNKTIDVSIKFIIWYGEDVSSEVANGDFAQKVLYEILVDNTILASNKAAFDVDGIYDYEFNISASTTFKVEGTLTIKDLVVNSSGELNVKLHPVITMASATSIKRIIYTDLEIEYKSDDEESDTFTKSRNIDFTTSTEITVPFGGDRSDLTYNNIQVNEFVTFTPYDIVIEAEDVAIATESYLYYSYNPTLFAYYSGPTTVWEMVIQLNEVSYNYLNKYRENIYIKRAATGDFELLTDYFLYENNVRGYVLTQVDAVSPILEADELYVRIPSQTITETNRNYLRAAWKRFNVTENVAYLDALARVYHSTIKSTKFKIEGNVFGLITPLDILQFNYLNAKNYNAVTLDLNLSEGQTQVTLIESVNKEITDYE